MIRFLVDTQLPPLLASYLQSKGYNSIHTTFFENGHLLQDSEISIIAKDEKRIIITKDSDFFERHVIYGPPPEVLLLQFGNISNKELLNYFERELETISALFEEGNALVIFNRNQLLSY